ncbi:MAG: hypothetical protein ACYDH9_26570 [Limisphaerales bacterium]
MSTVQEIEAAIQKLPPADRAKLIADLPALLPELEGDAAWERIVRDSRRRPALSEVLDRAEAEDRIAPATLAETSETEFDRHS